ncbi:MAG: competence type IV pilus major pilin ComGC [Candidatus Fimenecus sp.]
MRKVLNKKGFSLVELMIVVVIMGILIAVAVPLYGAVTGNAEKRTCQDNQRTIRTVYARTVLNEDNGNIESIFLPGKTSYNGEAPDTVFTEDFLKGFEGGELPKCPVDGTHYIITTSGSDISVSCSEGKHNS